MKQNLKMDKTQKKKKKSQYSVTFVFVIYFLSCFTTNLYLMRKNTTFYCVCTYAVLFSPFIYHLTVFLEKIRFAYLEN